MAEVWTPALGRKVELRVGGNYQDERVWSDTFTGLYHVPPEWMTAPATVLDVGANIGLTAAHYRALWPSARVVAVEMDEDCARQAALNAPDATVRCHAVSATGGWGSYNADASTDAFTFHQATPGGKPVSSYTLRQVIRRTLPGPVDLMKLDVEGSEWAILGLPNWAPLVRRVLIEFHPAGALDGDDAFLRSMGEMMLRRAGYENVAITRHPRGLFAWQGRP